MKKFTSMLAIIFALSLGAQTGTSIPDTEQPYLSSTFQVDENDSIQKVYPTFSVFAIDKKIKNGKVSINIGEDLINGRMITFGLTRSFKRSSTKADVKIDYGIKLFAQNNAYGSRDVRINENGVERKNPDTNNNTFSLFDDGDSFSVELKDGVVNYYRNGDKFYTSTMPPSDTDYSFMMTYGSNDSNKVPYNIVYDDYDNNIENSPILSPNINQEYYPNFLSINKGRTITYKNAAYGTTAWLDHKQEFENGGISFKANGRNQHHVGITTTPINVNDIRYNGGGIYGFYFPKARYGDAIPKYRITENGESIEGYASHEYTNGSTFKVEKNGSTINYIVNDSIVHTVTVDENQKYRLRITSAIMSENIINTDKFYIKDVKIYDPSKQDFQVKVVDDLYHLRTDAIDFKDIRKKLIDTDGNFCPDNICDTKVNTYKQIHLGNYSYHEGISTTKENRDESFWTNAGNDYYTSNVLNKEFSSINFLLKNNKNKKTKYQISVTLPSNDEDIYVRREANHDDYQYNAIGNDNLRFIGDALPIINYENGKWYLDAYPFEIIKLKAEFVSNSSQTESIIEVIEVDDSNNIIGNPIILNKDQFSINPLNKEIPNVEIPNISFSYLGYPRAFANDPRYFLMGDLLNKMDMNIHQVIDKKFIGSVEFDDDGNVISYRGDQGRLLTQVGGGFLDDSQNKVSIYMDGSGIPFDYLSDKWITAYISKLNAGFEYITKNINPNFTPDRYYVYPYNDETMIYGLTGYKKDQFIKLYQRLNNETDYKILGVFATNASNPSVFNDNVTNLIDYVDIAMTSGVDLANPKDVYKETSKLILEKKENDSSFDIWSYYADAGRETSGTRFYNPKALAKGISSSVSVYAYERMGGDDDWIGNREGSSWANDSTRDIGMLFNGSEGKATSVWNNATLKKDHPILGTYPYIYVNGRKVYDQAQGMVDAKLIKYLKSKNISLDNIIPNNEYDQSNYKEISNKLKELLSTDDNTTTITCSNNILDDTYVSGGNTPLGNKIIIRNSSFYIPNKIYNDKYSGDGYIKLDISDLDDFQSIILKLPLSRIGDHWAKGVGALKSELREVTFNNDWSEDNLLLSNIGDISISDDLILNRIIHGNTREIKFDITNLVKNAKNRGQNTLSFSINNTDNANRIANNIFYEFYSKENVDEDGNPNLDENGNLLVPYLEITSDANFMCPAKTKKVEVVEEKDITAFEKPLSFIVVYPNPTAGEVNVKAEKDIKAWKLVSMSGQTIGHKYFNTPKRNFVTNIGNQSGGIYNLTVIYSDGTSESKKISKK